MHNFWQDVRFGVRMLRKNPGFTVVAMVTLAFGIGASAAIFSVVDTVLLRSLPFPRPSELVAISAQVKAFDIPYLPLSYPDFVELRSSSSSLSSVAIYASDGKEFSSDDKPQRVENIQVSENFFAVLGMQPLYGRTFVASDMRPGSRAALLGFPSGKKDSAAILELLERLLHWTGSLTPWSVLCRRNLRWALPPSPTCGLHLYPVKNSLRHVMFIAARCSDA